MPPAPAPSPERPPPPPPHMAVLTGCRSPLSPLRHRSVPRSTLSRVPSVQRETSVGSRYFSVRVRDSSASSLRILHRTRVFAISYFSVQFVFILLKESTFSVARVVHFNTDLLVCVFSTTVISPGVSEDILSLFCVI